MRLYNLVILACTYRLTLHLKHTSCLMGKRRYKRPFSRRECFPLALWEKSGQSLCSWRVFSLTSISTRKKMVDLRPHLLHSNSLLIYLYVSLQSGLCCHTEQQPHPDRTLPLQSWRNFPGRLKGDCRAWVITQLAHPSCQVVRAAIRRSWLIMNHNKI